MMNTLLAESETLTLLEKFDLRGRTPQRAVESASKTGVVATIDCTSDPDSGARIEVTIAGHVATRQLPLSDFEAKTLVDEFGGEGLLAGEAALRAMVAHVFFRFSRLVMENPPIAHLRCEKLHVHPSDYRIDAVQIWVRSPLHVKPRLAEHAHDRKAMSGNRSGSGK